jgi:hypothetical protein
MGTEQINDELRGSGLFDVGENRSPVLVLQLEPGSESCGGGLTGRQHWAVLGYFGGHHNLQIKKNREIARPPPANGQIGKRNLPDRGLQRTETLSLTLGVRLCTFQELMCRVVPKG